MTKQAARMCTYSAFFLCTIGAFAPTPARAHFILVAPENWMSQDADGFPLKLGPCGDEGGGTATGAVTAFHPGQTIPITIDEVTFHPGHYRVALSVNDRSELPAEPPVTPAGGDPCASTVIQDPAVFPVLGDGMLLHTQPFAGPQTFYVTLPSDVTCTHCTLQVLEFMSSHPAPCFYHHCADLSVAGEVVTCGDGTLQAGEQCDDGNTSGGDGCDPACRIECAAVAQGKLIIGKLDAPAGNATLGFQGAMTLSPAISAALDPLADGVRLVIDGTAGPVLDVTVPGGTGWTVSPNGIKWTYRNTSATPPAGIAKVIVQDRSSASPGLVKFAVKGKAGVFTVTPADLPVRARLVVTSANEGCGVAIFPSCGFNGSGKTLKCR